MEWNLQYGRGWNNQVINFFQACREIAHKDQDAWKWLIASKFSIKSAAEALEQQAPVITWDKVVWSTHHLPRYAIIL